MRERKRNLNGLLRRSASMLLAVAMLITSITLPSLNWSMSKAAARTNMHAKDVITQSTNIMYKWEASPNASYMNSKNLSVSYNSKTGAMDIINTTGEGVEMEPLEGVSLSGTGDTKDITISGLEDDEFDSTLKNFSNGPWLTSVAGFEVSDRNGGTTGEGNIGKKQGLYINEDALRNSSEGIFYPTNAEYSDKEWIPPQYEYNITKEVVNEETKEPEQVIIGDKTRYVYFLVKYSADNYVPRMRAWAYDEENGQVSDNGLVTYRDYLNHTYCGELCIYTTKAEKQAHAGEGSCLKIAAVRNEIEDALVYAERDFHTGDGNVQYQIIWVDIAQFRYTNNSPIDYAVEQVAFEINGADYNEIGFYYTEEERAARREEVAEKTFSLYGIYGFLSEVEAQAFIAQDIKDESVNRYNSMVSAPRKVVNNDSVTILSNDILPGVYMERGLYINALKDTEAGAFQGTNYLQDGWEVTRTETDKPVNTPLGVVYAANDNSLQVEEYKEADASVLEHASHLHATTGHIVSGNQGYVEIYTTRFSLTGDLAQYLGQSLDYGFVYDSYSAGRDVNKDGKDSATNYNTYYQSGGADVQMFSPIVVVEEGFDPSLAAEYSLSGASAEIGYHKAHVYDMDFAFMAPRFDEDSMGTTNGHPAGEGDVDDTQGYISDSVSTDNYIIYAHGITADGTFVSETTEGATVVPAEIHTARGSMSYNLGPNISDSYEKLVLYYRNTEKTAVDVELYIVDDNNTVTELADDRRVKLVQTVEAEGEGYLVFDLPVGDYEVLDATVGLSNISCDNMPDQLFQYSETRTKDYTIRINGCGLDNETSFDITKIEFLEPHTVTVTFDNELDLEDHNAWNYNNNTVGVAIVAENGTEYTAANAPVDGFFTETKDKETGDAVYTVVDVPCTSNAKMHVYAVQQSDYNFAYTIEASRAEFIDGKDINELAQSSETIVANTGVNHVNYKFPVTVDTQIDIDLTWRDYTDNVTAGIGIIKPNGSVDINVYTELKASKTTVLTGEKFVISAVPAYSTDYVAIYVQGAVIGTDAPVATKPVSEFVNKKAEFVIDTAGTYTVYLLSASGEVLKEMPLVVNDPIPYTILTDAGVYVQGSTVTVNATSQNESGNDVVAVFAPGATTPTVQKNLADGAFEFTASELGTYKICIYEGNADGCELTSARLRKTATVSVKAEVAAEIKVDRSSEEIPYLTGDIVKITAKSQNLLGTDRVVVFKQDADGNVDFTSTPETSFLVGYNMTHMVAEAGIYTAYIFENGVLENSAIKASVSFKVIQKVENSVSIADEVTLGDPIYVTATSQNYYNQDFIAIYVKGERDFENKYIYKMALEGSSNAVAINDLTAVENNCTDGKFVQYANGLPTGEYTVYLFSGDDYETILAQKDVKVVAKQDLTTDPFILQEENGYYLRTEKNTFVVGETFNIYASGVSANDCIAIYDRSNYSTPVKTIALGDDLMETWNIVGDLPEGNYRIFLFKNSGTDGSNFSNYGAAVDITVSTNGTYPFLSTDKDTYAYGEEILVNAGTYNSDGWVGIYGGDVQGKSILHYMISAENNGKSFVMQKGTQTSDDTGVDLVGGRTYALILYAMDGDGNVNDNVPVARKDISIEAATKIDAPVAGAYTIDDPTSGMANGTIKVWTDASIDDANRAKVVRVYWGNEKGEWIGTYNYLAHIEVNGTYAEYVIDNNLVIPAEAKTLLFYGAEYDSTEKKWVYSEELVFKLPANCQFAPNETATEFQIVSDTHIMSDSAAIDGNSHYYLDYYTKNNQHFTNMLSDIKTQSPTSNGLVIAGDVVDWYGASYYEKIKELYKNSAFSDLEMYWGMGNHEKMYTDNVNATNDGFMSYGEILGNVPASGEYKDSPYYEYWTGGTDGNGIHLLFLASESENYTEQAVISQEQTEWFEREVKAHMTTYNGKPLFVFLHQPIYGSVAGGLEGDNWDGVIDKADQDGNGSTHISKGLYHAAEINIMKTLAEYPNAMLFSGHSHFDMYSEGNAHIRDDQMGNAFNTASVGYLWTTENAADTSGQSWIDAYDGTESGSQGYYIEVYEDRVIIRGRDFASGQWLANAQYCVMLDTSGAAVESQYYDISIEGGHSGYALSGVDNIKINVNTDKGTTVNGKDAWLAIYPEYTADNYKVENPTLINSVKYGYLKNFASGAVTIGDLTANAGSFTQGTYYAVVMVGEANDRSDYAAVSNVVKFSVETTTSGHTDALYDMKLENTTLTFKYNSTELNDRWIAIYKTDATTVYQYWKYMNSNDGSNEINIDTAKDTITVDVSNTGTIVPGTEYYAVIKSNTEPYPDTSNKIYFTVPAADLAVKMEVVERTDTSVKIQYAGEDIKHNSWIGLFTTATPSESDFTNAGWYGYVTTADSGKSNSTNISVDQTNKTATFNGLTAGKEYYAFVVWYDDNMKEYITQSLALPVYTTYVRVTEKTASTITVSYSGTPLDGAWIAIYDPSDLKYSCAWTNIVGDEGSGKKEGSSYEASVDRATRTVTFGGLSSDKKYYVKVCQGDEVTPRSNTICVYPSNAALVSPASEASVMTLSDEVYGPVMVANSEAANAVARVLEDNLSATVTQSYPVTSLGDAGWTPTTIVTADQTLTVNVEIPDASKAYFNYTDGSAYFAMYPYAVAHANGLVVGGSEPKDSFDDKIVGGKVSIGSNGTATKSYNMSGIKENQIIIFYAKENDGTKLRYAGHIYVQVESNHWRILGNVAANIQADKSVYEVERGSAGPDVKIDYNEFVTNINEDAFIAIAYTDFTDKDLFTWVDGVLYLDWSKKSYSLSNGMNERVPYYYVEGTHTDGDGTLADNSTITLEHPAADKYSRDYLNTLLVYCDGYNLAGTQLWRISGMDGLVIQCKDTPKKDGATETDKKAYYADEVVTVTGYDDYLTYEIYRWDEFNLIKDKGFGGWFITDESVAEDGKTYRLNVAIDEETHTIDLKDLEQFGADEYVIVAFSNKVPGVNSFGYTYRMIDSYKRFLIVEHELAENEAYPVFTENVTESSSTLDDKTYEADYGTVEVKFGDKDQTSTADSIYGATQTMTATAIGNNTFIGWFELRNDGDTQTIKELITTDATYQVKNIYNEDITLYALFVEGNAEDIKYVKFINDSGETMTMIPSVNGSEVDLGDIDNTINIPVKVGYKFEKWDIPSLTDKKANITYYKDAVVAEGETDITNEYIYGEEYLTNNEAEAIFAVVEGKGYDVLYTKVTTTAEDGTETTAWELTSMINISETVSIRAKWKPANATTNSLTLFNITAEGTIDGDGDESTSWNFTAQASTRSIVTIMTQETATVDGSNLKFVGWVNTLLPLKQTYFMTQNSVDVANATTEDKVFTNGTVRLGSAYYQIISYKNALRFTATCDMTLRPIYVAEADYDTVMSNAAPSISMSTHAQFTSVSTEKTKVVFNAMLSMDEELAADGCNTKFEVVEFGYLIFLARDGAVPTTKFYDKDGGEHTVNFLSMATEATGSSKFVKLPGNDKTSEGQFYGAVTTAISNTDAEIYVRPYVIYRDKDNNDDVNDDHWTIGYGNTIVIPVAKHAEGELVSKDELLWEEQELDAGAYVNYGNGTTVAN